MAVYSFDTEDAKRFGQEEAVLLFNIRYWVAKNKANGKHFYEGRYWTYNSMEAYQELFDFWTPKQIRRILESLKKQGATLEGNFNENPYDRTKWYTTANWPICPNGQMELPERANGDAQTGKCITDNKPDSKPDTSKEGTGEGEEYHVILSHMNAATGKKYQGDKTSKGSLHARLKEGYTVPQIKAAITAASKDEYHRKKKYQYLTMEYILRPAQLDRWVNMAGDSGVAQAVPVSERKQIGWHRYVDFNTQQPVSTPVYEGDPVPFGFIPLRP